MKRIAILLLATILLMSGNVFAAGGPESGTVWCYVYVNTSTSSQGQIYAEASFHASNGRFGYFNAYNGGTWTTGGGSFSNVRVRGSISSNRRTAKIRVSYTFHYAHGRTMRGSKTCGYTA